MVKDEEHIQQFMKNLLPVRVDHSSIFSTGRSVSPQPRTIEGVSSTYYNAQGEVSYPVPDPRGTAYTHNRSNIVIHQTSRRAHK